VTVHLAAQYRRTSIVKFIKFQNGSIFARTLQGEKVKKESKAVPLHAMEAHGGRGGIAPTHS
jgi:hypothetical protein